jgi:adenylosuccinate synthase
MEISIVLDLGFGDSGKGVTVDYLAQHNPKESLVVRFSGGHQVGHTVKVGEFIHSFSNFGAGTLRGIPTYYTKHTTIFPPAIVIEYQQIKQFAPHLIFDPLVMVTTPYDIAFNRVREKLLQHGSCGVGFAATIDRNLDGVKLFVKDLANAWVFQKKLEAVKNYYLSKTYNTNLDNAFREEAEKLDDSKFMELSQECSQLYSLDNFTNLKGLYKHIIFEGSQGIMLDQEHGIFPYVTRSSTTSKNALEVLEDASVTVNKIDIYYVTRCYQTRHGNGPMSNHTSVKLQNNETEMNQDNQYQGAFRVAELDVELLKYALSCDLIYHTTQNINKILVITCLDQRPDFDLESLLQQLKNYFYKVYLNFSPNAEFRYHKIDLV